MTVLNNDKLIAVVADALMKSWAEQDPEGAPHWRAKAESLATDFIRMMQVYEAAKKETGQ